MHDKKKSKMKCHVCGEMGHSRNECPGVDDGGAAQSIHKGNSTAKNNTGEKKKKGKDKVRAQKMMRGAKKKERGMSIDEKEGSAITYPETSVSFHDIMLSSSPAPEAKGEEGGEKTHLIAGFISSCAPSMERSYAFTFNHPMAENSPGLLGYALGVPPQHSAGWLNHMKLNNGEDIAFSDMVTTVGNRLKAIGPVGLDYREKVMEMNSRDDQLEVFRRQVMMTAEYFILSSTIN
jgi:hypothetical protein